MAVEAARDALVGRDRGTIAALRFASTTFPFLDRLHSGIVAGALSLPEDISAIDVAATQRAGTSALIEALVERQRDAGGRLREARRQGREPRRDDERRRRRGHPGRRRQAGRHAAGQGLAHGRFRRPLPLPRQPVRLPVGGALDPRCRLHGRRAAGDQALPGGGQGRAPRTSRTSACRRRWRASPTRSPRRPASTTRPICDPLHANCGDTGAAHTLMLLVATLEKSKPGDKILLVGFGQGADALLFEVTLRDRQAAEEPGRRRPSRAPQGGAELRPLPRLQRPDRARARHALGDRQGDRAVLAVAQPRDGHELHRRQVLQVRHAADAENRHLRQPELQRASHAGALPVRRHGRPHQVLHGRPPHLLARSALVLWHDRVRGRRPGDDRLHRHRRRRAQGRPADADDVPHQGHRHRTRLPPLLLESRPEGGPKPRRF